MQADDPHNLNRFLMAQASTWPAALAELRAGQKRSHWMWFVFPQIAGLGHSAMARTYAIASLVEARAYLAHPLLGARYREGVAALMTHAGRSAAAIMGDVDAMKLRSSLTLFAAAGEESADAALTRFFDGPDPATTDRIG